MIKKYWNKQMLFEQKDYIMFQGTLFVWKKVLVNRKKEQHKVESSALLIKFCVKFWYIFYFNIY